MGGPHEVLLGKPAIERRLHAILAELDQAGIDLFVLLCTSGSVRGRNSSSRGIRWIISGRDWHVAPSGSGFCWPNVAQIEEFHGIRGVAITGASASPYVAEPAAGSRAAAIALADTDMIVMHCIGHSEAMPRVVREVSGRPVVVSRRVVARAIDLLLS